MAEAEVDRSEPPTSTYGKWLDVLTDKSLAQEVTAQDRTLGRIAWHIVLTIHEMMTHAGLSFDAPSDDTKVPVTAKEIADGYRQASKAFVTALKEQWTDEGLQEDVNMYGQIWKKSFVLAVLIQHQVHHRGQMTVLMRQAGLRVPGVFGPAREEWSAMGVAEPPVV
ncbi:DinB family protein [Aneurinibacillus thermoaerophilus]|uniref:DinB family protein n=1 Tax=Aneurinibacillus thermoaerophilus TaxID=143495 RepID=UPI002E1B8858|nr:DinB family protein [Aneurinibacillus thermoaerophilus]MED0763005.1 DinB family protein [Aneurinibacillus thermoaerophilus]